MSYLRKKRITKFSESDQIIKGIDFNSRIGIKLYS